MENIEVLPPNSRKIIKRIMVNELDSKGKNHRGDFLYMRDLSLQNNYIMRKNVSDSEKDCFEILANGKPEEQYPKDELDDLILEKVQEKYRTATVRSSQLLTNRQLADLQLYKSDYKKKIEYTLYIEPQINNGYDAISDGLNEFQTLQLPLDFYTNPSEDYFLSDVYKATFDPRIWNEVFGFYRNLIKTMHRLSEYL